MNAAAIGVVQFADLLGGWEIVLILAVVLLLFGMKRLPEIFKGLGRSVDAFGNASRDVQSDLGRSLGAAAGKPVAEALTHWNETAEDTAQPVFHPTP